MSFEVEGTLHKKFDTESKTDSFQAREFVIETGGNYPQFIKFQLVQDRCDLLDPYQEGHEIKVHFDLRGREWNDKFFTNLNAWRVEAVIDTGVAATPAKPLPGSKEQPTANGALPTAKATPRNASPSAQDMPVGANDTDDDLPF